MGFWDGNQLIPWMRFAGERSNSNGFFVTAVFRVGLVWTRSGLSLHWAGMADIYETDRYVGEYLLFHFGNPKEILPWPEGPEAALDFAVRTVEHFSKSLVERSLDVGCAVGRSAMELGRTSGEVIGIDFSRAFIEAAQRVARGEVLSVERLEEGHFKSGVEIVKPEGLSGDGVSFETGDAMDLRADLGQFDRVHAANLVCRLPEPRRFLERLPDLLVPGGELVLATPCTWLEEFTQRENWPPGRTLDWLKTELKSDFELVSTADEPFLIRETARKFQWTVSMVSKWIRR